MNMNFNSVSDEHLLNSRSMCEFLCISKSTLWRWVEGDRNFPKPIKMSTKTRAWRLGEVRAWINARARG